MSTPISTPTDTPYSETVGINSPGLKPTGELKPRVRSIKDETQAWQVIQKLERDNDLRNRKNARIMAKYNAEKPHNQKELEAEGLGWKSNFSTKPLATLIDKVSPRFTRAIDELRYFTSSALPDSVTDASKKSEIFQKEVTSTIRSRPEWKDYIAEVAQENALFGYTSVGWLNEFDWFPKHFRQDNFFIPTGTTHCVTNAQVLVFREQLLPSEAFALISDKSAAESAGWDIENTVNAINSAMPDNLRSRTSGYERVYEDLQRESGTGSSFVEGAKVVLYYHLFATELDGQVSHYIVEARSHKQVFKREDQFKTMAECASFYSFQHGNGKMHGSKGIGREIYNMAGVLDRSRNEVVDRLQLAGKLIIQAEPKMLNRFKMHVVGNTILIGKNYEIAERKIESNVEDFMTLDQYMNTLLDGMVGNVSPRQLEGDRVTKAQVDLFASREEEAKDSKVARFLSQFAAMITVMQRKMCSPHVSEDDAKEMQKRLLKVMSKDELKQLAESSSATVVKDFTDLERQMVTLIATENRGNPLYNQKELERRKLTAQMGADFAESVLLPDNDPTVVAEQSRQQQIELLYIAQTASDVPVSPRDNHLVHLEVLRKAIEGAMEPLANDPSQLPQVQAMVSHAKQHVEAGTQLADKQNYSAFASFLTQASQRLATFAAHEEAASKAVQAGAAPTDAANAGAAAAQQAMPPTEAPPQAQ
jgi:hypothetical protein